MKKLTDEQIQAMLESELKPSEDILSPTEKEQLESYVSLFQKLKTEPGQGLPFSFASKVTGELKIKLKKKSDIRFNLFAALGVIGGIIAAFALLTIVDVRAGNDFLLAILKFKWLLIFGLLILLSSLMFDQKIVERS